MIDVEEEKENSKGISCVALSSQTRHRAVPARFVKDGSRRSCFEFRGAAPGAIAPSVQTSKVRRVSPPPPPLSTCYQGYEEDGHGQARRFVKEGRAFVGRDRYLIRPGRPVLLLEKTPMNKI